MRREHTRSRHPRVITSVCPLPPAALATQESTAGACQASVRSPALSAAQLEDGVKHGLVPLLLRPLARNDIVSERRCMNPRAISPSCVSAGRAANAYTRGEPGQGLRRDTHRGGAPPTHPPPRDSSHYTGTSKQG
jgi:hypothetical protein